MSGSSTRPLPELERLLVLNLVDARTRVARTMTLIVAFLDVVFCFRLWARATHSNRWAMVGIGAAMTAIFAWIVWHFGWGLVRRMRKDLENGVKQTVTGTITRIATSPNAYGETATSVTIGSEVLLTKADIFASAKEGDAMSVEYLPLSKVALRATSAEA